jgi:hypothetical protein
MTVFFRDSSGFVHYSHIPSVNMPSLSSPSLGEGSRTLRSGSTYATPNEGSSPSRTLKRGDLRSGDSRRPVPAWAQAAGLAREENQRVLRQQLDAPLVYEAGGIFPPARLCPRAIQAKAKSDAQAALAVLLRTPVHGVVAPCPATALPVITVPPPNTASQELNDCVWHSSVGSYYRRQAAKNQHSDGHATLPVAVLDDSDTEDSVAVTSTVAIIVATHVHNATALLHCSSATMPPRTTVPPPTPCQNGITACSEVPVPTRGDLEPDVSMSATTVVTANSWGVHPLMASSCTLHMPLSGSDPLPSELLH